MKYLADVNYFRKIKNSGWMMLSSTIEIRGGFKTSTVGLKVLITSTRIFSNASWLSSSLILFLFVSV